MVFIFFCFGSVLRLGAVECAGPGDPAVAGKYGACVYRLMVAAADDFYHR